VKSKNKSLPVISRKDHGTKGREKKRLYAQAWRLQHPKPATSTRPTNQIASNVGNTGELEGDHTQIAASADRAISDTLSTSSVDLGGDGFNDDGFNDGGFDVRRATTELNYAPSILDLDFWVGTEVDSNGTNELENRSSSSQALTKSVSLYSQR